LGSVEPLGLRCFSHAFDATQVALTETSSLRFFGDSCSASHVFAELDIERLKLYYAAVLRASQKVRKSRPLGVSKFSNNQEVLL